MQAAVIQLCPSCSRVLTFTSNNSNIITCSGCGSTINRNADGSLVYKPHYTVSINSGIIQPGTTGVWDKKTFTVLGRFRAWFEESVFNYWTIQFADGETAWLGEGYGIYSILTQTFPAETLTELQDFDIGQKIGLENVYSYILEKKYTTSKWEIEGELYIPDNMASSFKVFEFSNQNSGNLTYFEFSNQVFVFETTYTSFEALQLSNLREYIITPKEFSCTNCKATILVKTFPYAQSCACVACGAQYALKYTMDYKMITVPDLKESGVIPLGSTGKLRGINYEVVGYVQKEEDNVYHSRWREYTLYNSAEGYAFLSEYEGNWIYIRENSDCPVLIYDNNNYFHIDDKEYKLFNSYTYKVINGQGEFPYNIYDNNKTKVKEFISPPRVWIQEKDNEEGITWYLGKHITGKEIEKAYPDAVLPWKGGIGAVQPVGNTSGYTLFKATFVAALLLLLVHAWIGYTKQERNLFENTIVFDSTDQVSFVTEKYTLDKWRSNIRFDISAPVSNSWFELGVTMVNAKTGKEYSLEQGVEYYYGYSDGETWTEGSSREKAYLTRIPAGTYFFQIQGTRENLPDGLKISSFFLSIDYDVPSNRNIWWAIGILLLWPVGAGFYMYNGEKARWGNSPFNPYNSEE